MGFRPVYTANMKQHQSSESRKPAVTIRALHLDFKGVPPCPGRLPALLDLVAAAHYNALLVEWEDMFPWTVDRRFRASTAYTPSQVRAFGDAARARGLQIIPLVQCLGHMETPLSVADYRHLRQVPYRVDCLNPLARGARELIERMIDDVLALTPDVRYFHLGGDEARTLDWHPRSAAFIARHGRAALYLHHVEPLLDRLAARKIRPVLWSDMMHDWSDAEIKRIGAKADLCPWGYKGHPDHWTHHSATKNIRRFHANGVTLWGGTAYKGTEAPDADLGQVEDRVNNALAWVEISRRFGMSGLIATAWSRHASHLMQTQPIDACLDALVCVGLALHDGSKPDMKACRRILARCGEWNRFQACHAAMEKLTEMRTYAWGSIHDLRQQIALEEADPRRATGAAMADLIDLKRHLEVGGQEACTMIRQAFNGSLHRHWMQRYFDDRMNPLLEELAELEPRVRRLEPEPYRAARHFRQWNRRPATAAVSRQRG